LTDQLDELDKIIKGFTANEAPVKAKRNNQRKDLEKAKEDIAELTVRTTLFIPLIFRATSKIAKMAFGPRPTR
jgi:hypothetical protein